MRRLRFSSTVSASPAQAWDWITSVRGIATELSPYMRMSHPRHVHSLADLDFEPGKPLFRSIIYLFGVLPVDFSHMTLLALTPGEGFVEQSPMGSMRRWRHERRIQPLERGCRIEDALAFEPRIAAPVAAWWVRRLFTHRHAVLRARLGPVRQD